MFDGHGSVSTYYILFKTLLKGKISPPLGRDRIGPQNTIDYDFRQERYILKLLHFADLIVKHFARFQ